MFKDREAHRKLDRILSLLEGLQTTDKQLTREFNMASKDLVQEVTDLQAVLAENTSATRSVESLINAFAAQLEAAAAEASDDTEAVASMKDVIAHFRANDTALAQAVLAGSAPIPSPPAQPLPPIVAPPPPPVPPLAQSATAPLEAPSNVQRDGDGTPPTT